MSVALHETSFEFPEQVGEPYHGKVGDVYTIDHEVGELLAVVRTDRISAYDVVLPDPVPLKGQVLNQLSAELLAATEHVAPNWLIDATDPNASIGYKASPFKIEMIARGFLLGSSWKGYQKGDRELCGNTIPDGMSEFEAFDVPLLTPTTKADAGHDENITPSQIVAQGFASSDEYEEMADMAFRLFAEGQAQAKEKGLLLADTKYEFGRLASGKIVLIDEVHTPDSSRYFPDDEFTAHTDGKTTDRPEQLSKEFVREWLAAQGFTGQPGQQPPRLPEAFKTEVSGRYIDLYQRMLGKEFKPATEATEAAQHARIYDNVVKGLSKLAIS